MPPLSFPLDNVSKGVIENTNFNTLRVLKLYTGLPVFTATPTYTGFEGEMVWLYDATHYSLYAYINKGWRQIGTTDLTDSGATTLHTHAGGDHGALSGLDDDDHGAIYYTETEIDNFAVKLTGNQSISELKTFTTHTPVVPIAAPIIDTQLTNKKYVDDSHNLLGTITDDVTVVNDTTDEQTLFTFAIPGGTLSTTNAVKVRIFIDYTDGSASTQTFRLKYGSTTIASKGVIMGNVTNAMGYIDIMLMTTDGNVTKQDGSFVLALNNGEFVAENGAITTENSTSALNLVFTMEDTADNSAVTIIMRHAIVERIH